MMDRVWTNNSQAENVEVVSFNPYWLVVVFPDGMQHIYVNADSAGVKFDWDYITKGEMN